MTKGQYRVGTTFNPNGNEEVDNIKQRAAELIDLIESVGDNTIPEVGRLRALASTAIEEGAMWAVKAATKRPTP